MAKFPRRVLLKLSGETLKGPQDFGVHSQALIQMASELVQLNTKGLEMGVVIGGGNIFRGIEGAFDGFDRVSADHMGMLATIFNGIALEQALEKQGVKATVMSAFAIDSMVKPFNHKDAIKALMRGEIVIFVGGTGNPFFSTDTGAALRASQIHAEALLKATKVDGVYSADPIKHPEATRYQQISYQEVLEKKLGIMDPAAVVLCRDNNIPIRVFQGNQAGLLPKAALDQSLGTLIK